MKVARMLAFLAVCFLLSCQSATVPPVTVIDNDQILTLDTNERLPSIILEQAGVALHSGDRLLINGLPAEASQAITAYPVTLQIRRARLVTIVTSDGEQELHTSAFTTGEALQEAYIWLHAGEGITPSLNSPVSDPTITIHQLPTHNLTITTDTGTFQATSSAETVGEALAETGIPLIGLDYSLPSENEPIPSDGQVRVVRVSESMQLAQKPIPFESEIQASADVPLDQTQILQPGETGLTVQRIRIRYEDAEEVSRLTEDETMVRPPKTRVLGYGTKIEVKSAVVDGVNIEYWRAVQMYATSYSPCRSGADRCYSGTSSGKSLRKGMVGLRYSWYLSMQGQQVYIPGYGFGSVEDVCGGCVGQPWIDLGFSDRDFEPWHSWVTVYFLTPVPANVIYVLE
jgi:resuscitation-promoting factor RpfB